MARDTAGLEMLQARLMGVANNIIDNIDHYASGEVRDPEAVLHWVNVLHGTLAAIYRSEQTPENDHPFAGLIGGLRVVGGDDEKPKNEDEDNGDDAA